MAVIVQVRSVSRSVTEREAIDELLTARRHLGTEMAQDAFRWSVGALGGVLGDQPPLVDALDRGRRPANSRPPEACHVVVDRDRAVSGILHGRLYSTLPKGGKTRVVDMPPSVVSALADYFLEFPAVEVELPWGGPEGDRGRRKFPLILTTTYGNALRANTFNVDVWKPALAVAGVIPIREAGERWAASRKDGFHVLRHTYASVILEAGESVVTPARWLGHSSPTTTLDYCAHFVPEAGGKGRSPIDTLLARTSQAAVAA